MTAVLLDTMYRLYRLPFQQEEKPGRLRNSPLLSSPCHYCSATDQSRNNLKHRDSAYTSTKARLTTVAYPDSCPGSPPKFSQLRTGPLPTFPENFRQIR